MYKTLKTFLSAVAAALGLALALTVVQPAAAQAAAGQISLSPTTGPAGSAITVTGSGFKASTNGTVIIGSATFPLKTTATGTFSAPATIPAAATGKITVTAKTSSVQASAVFTVAVPTTTTAPAPAPTVSTARLQFGTATNGGPLASAELDEVAALAGEAPSSVLFYKDFLQPAPITEMNAVRSRGAVPLVTWEPWAWGGGVNQPAYSLDRIAAGDFDAHIAQWGQALAAWGYPVQLRFAHEMNGDWYPWAESVNGNQPGDYVQAWRHVHDVVEAQGASNVSWVWSPNVPYWGSTDLAGLYPGAGYVDVVALDGYNWGTSASWSGWISPQDLFAPGIAQLRALAPGTPILIAETASSEAGGDKAAWNTQLISYLAAQPDVMGFVWFHIQKEADWRINSSAASATAFKNALLARRTS
ncbi:beta-mannanase-like protein [Pseudarthrobacter chlorophenolicus A6]|uniref:Beta-mannanase-like protein n=1 Tax=Pseudarthrobacter chlorophenolicus (strain ATCC 700700 / DSM 12829 / CIP 107037 / JCM 12360 / KCTC 9906 / NCIMB 13794 / A6) TaxID=452863 RepID=B8HEH2_PSECP|nr:glycosyl hydrolase [Pseudarthrobacter chlorophenolicus]ACL40917.1 beta-mannanase-like protein [Pseudarthrobacter chlorophenolicus A6]SDQ72942.1 Glycosyl hydrolase family 26 [Pseudarthrobacter chlorophenolicus]